MTRSLSKLFKIPSTLFGVFANLGLAVLAVDRFAEVRRVVVFAAERFAAARREFAVLLPVAAGAFLALLDFFATAALPTSFFAFDAFAVGFFVALLAFVFLAAMSISVAGSMMDSEAVYCDWSLLALQPKES